MLTLKEKSLKDNSIIIKYGYNKEDVFFKSRIFDDKEFALYIPINSLSLPKKNNSLELLSQNLTFIIDPITYLWLDNNILNLSDNKQNILNKIFKENVKNKIEYLKDENNLKEIIKNTFYLQKKYYDELLLNPTMNDIERQYLSFIDYIQKDLEYFVAPYFAITSKDFDDLIQINSKIIEIVSNDDEMSNKQIIFNLLLDKKVAKDKRCLEQILHRYKDFLKTKKFLFWIDDFTFLKLNSTEISNLKNFLEKFQSSTKLLLHADFITSILLNKNFISYPFSHVITNLGYGESRQIFNNGGRMKIYYYINKLHKRVNAFEFSEYLKLKKILDPESNGNILKELFLEEICNCEYCNDLLLLENNIYKIMFLLSKNNQELNEKEKKKKYYISNYFLFHFLKSKIREYENMKNYSSNELKIYLENMIQEYEDFPISSLSKKQKESIKKIIENLG